MITESIWSQSCRIAARPQLKENIETEVAVIGAGLAGLLIAERLQREGKEVVILEAERIAGGQTKNTTAKITAQHGCIYATLIRRFGQEKAKEYALANRRAVEWYRQYIKQEKIDCDFELQDAFLYSQSQRTKMQNEAAACQALGLSAEFIEKIELPFPVAGAVCMKGQAQFHPLRFVHHIADKLKIYENTRVTKVKNGLLYCDRAAVKAKQVIFACHYPFVNYPGLFFVRMHQTRSYVLALENAPELNGMYIDAEQGGYSFRRYQNLLLLGGGGHRTGKNSTGGKYALLQRAAEDMFPGCRIVAQWSAQDCMTVDEVPYIGRFSKSRPNWYVVTGFGKWGMTSAALAAEILTDLLCKKKNSALSLFTPHRFPVINAVKIPGEGLESAKGLIKENLSVPRIVLENLPVGHGGIVEQNGKKVGVYRESEEKYYTVQTQCPHLGCQLEWNPDEKSWDCPCHGSRYDYKGHLIDNPAQKVNINIKEE
ncbi:MAG: FAD-dependent oxidoreductase [Clostridia bacterium]|nr:FAD-dependent oxidoreductase [Clostridia bacterium]